MGMNTEEFAHRNLVKPASVISRYCKTGSYYGARPRKLPNGRLDWPDDAQDQSAIQRTAAERAPTAP